MIAFPKREWPKVRGEGVITEEVRLAAVALALRTSNKNAARVYGVAPQTIGSWVIGAGHPAPRLGRRPNAVVEGWRKEGLQVVGVAEYRPLPYRPKLTAAQIAQRGNHKKRLLRAERLEERLDHLVTMASRGSKMGVFIPGGTTRETLEAFIDGDAARQQGGAE